jgi:hypothetical protein
MPNVAHIDAKAATFSSPNRRRLAAYTSAVSSRGGVVLV